VKGFEREKKPVKKSKTRRSLKEEKNFFAAQLFCRHAV
jgi:hypothetical protein